jgi:SAM-dependent methyltransferase
MTPALTIAHAWPQVDHPGWLAVSLAGALMFAALTLWPLRNALAWGTDDAEMADEIAAMLQLKPGSAVAEIGAGHGQMAIRMAQKVGPSGHVYATEIDPKRLDEIRERARQAGLDNLTVIQATPSDTGLPAGCCDGIYMIGVYHHVTDPSATDASIAKALKPGGRLVVNDFPPTLWLAWFKVKGVPTNRGGHGVPDRIVTDEFGAAGLHEVQELKPWHAGLFIRDNYCLLFSKS